MFIGKVTGTVVASQKIKSVVGKKLLLIQALTVDGSPPALKTTGRVAVAVDTVGAGEGELVLVTQGSSARLTDMTSNVPTDAVVVGIIDAIQMGEQEIYKQRGDEK
jgi:ethanolamine utilization protein EutN